MKKGFTLIELLATIIVLAVISMIAVGVVSNSINSSKKKTFEINASNLLDAAKDYVTKSMENNDFPEGGLEVNSKELEIKNNPFVSGIIKRNKEEQIVLENVTDGKYCANGPKSNIEITEGNCEATDETPPTLKIKELKTTSTSSKIMIKTQDSVSGIETYTYCIKKEKENYKEEDCVLVKKNKEKKLIKEIKELEKLEIGTNYNIKVIAKDGKGNETTNEIQITTKEIEEPKFKISTTTYALIKKLTIIYPETNEGYTKYYQIINEKENKEEIVEVKEQEETLEIKENVKIRAYVKKDDTEIVSSEIDVVGLDKEGPKVNVVISEIDKWTKEKTMVINATDEGVGLALKPYIDNGFGVDYLKWNRENSITLISSGQLKIKVRDRLGNVNKKFTINGNIECCVDCKDMCELNNIDSEGPIIKYEIIEGTKQSETNEWYTSAKVVIKVTVTDKMKKIDDEGKETIVDGGVGVSSDTIKINSDNKSAVIDKQSNEVYLITLTENGIYNITIYAEDILGNKSKDSGTITIKKDSYTPSIKAKKTLNDYKTDETNKKISSYFNYKYGVSKGKIVCKDTSTKKTVETINNVYLLGKSSRKVECTIEGTNGLSASAKTSFRNYYKAIEHKENPHDCNCQTTTCCGAYYTCTKIEIDCVKQEPKCVDQGSGPGPHECEGGKWDSSKYPSYVCCKEQPCKNEETKKETTCRDCTECKKCDTCFDYVDRCDYGGELSNGYCYY